MPARLRVRHTTAQKLHLRRHKRKHGPSALRRAERRQHLQVKECVAPAVLAVSATAFADAMKELNDGEEVKGA